MLLGMSVVLNRIGRWGRHNVSIPCTVGIITKIVLISITSVDCIIFYYPDCSIKSRSLVPCQLSRDFVGYEVSNKWRLDVSALFFIDNSKDTWRQQKSSDDKSSNRRIKVKGLREAPTNYLNCDTRRRFTVQRFVECSHKDHHGIVRFPGIDSNAKMKMPEMPLSI